MATERGIGTATVHTCLARVCHQAGTNHQAQCVALLKGASSGVFYAEAVMKGVEDQIYEAAFVPEFWPQVLTGITETTGIASGAMMMVDPLQKPLFSTTPNIEEVVAHFATTPQWYTNKLLWSLKRRRYAGFLEVTDFLAAEDPEDVAFHGENMRRMGTAWQLGSVVDMPEGGFVAFTFERALGEPDFSAGELAHFDALRPHLARASMIAMRLELQRAETSVATLEALGMPAAVVDASGAVVAANCLFESLSSIVRPGAFGRVSLANREASVLLQQALFEAAPIRSIPVGTAERGNLVLHVLPLRRSASDIFARGSAMLIATGYTADANVPPDAVLRGLFDLSAAEADVAAGLASGLSLADVAAKRGIVMATARTHLASIFRKTGTSQQGQLVALLKGVSGASPLMVYG